MITLSKIGIEIVEWALEPMIDFWGNDEQDLGRVYPESDLPKVEGICLTLSRFSEINEDLIYRLLHQLPDVLEGNLDGTASTQKKVTWKIIIAEGIVEKIRAENDS